MSRRVGVRVGHGAAQPHGRELMYFFVMGVGCVFGGCAWRCWVWLGWYKCHEMCVFWFDCVCVIMAGRVAFESFMDCVRVVEWCGGVVLDHVLYDWCSFLGLVMGVL